MAQIINQEDWSNEIIKPKFTLGDTIKFNIYNEDRIGFIYEQGQSLHAADISEYYYHVKTISNQLFIVNEESIEGICQMLLSEIMEPDPED